MPKLQDGTAMLQAVCTYRIGMVIL